MKLPLVLTAGLATASADHINSRLQGRTSNKSHPVNIKLSSWGEVAEYQWYGEVSIGTPAQRFNLLFDTGSADIAVAKKGCKHCGDYTTFDLTKSSTFSSKPGDKTNASYSTAADAQPLEESVSAPGQIVSDTVSIGGLEVKNQPFFLADDFPEELGKEPLGPDVEGIFGLGPPGVSILGAEVGKNLSTTFWSLVESGAVPEPVFGLALDSGNSSGAGWLTLGGVDKSMYKGELERVPFNASASAQVGQWLINTPEFFVDGKVIQNSQSNESFSAGISIVDSGTAFIEVPNQQTAKDMYAAISPKIKMLDKLGTWGAPCKVMEDLKPELTFTIGAGEKLLNLTMPRDAFNLGEHAKHPGQCQAVLVHRVVPIKIASVWILGSPLLKGYYTAWDGGNFELGVGERADPQPDSKDDSDDNSEDEEGEDTGTSGAKSLTMSISCIAFAVGLHLLG